jgi:hypothetical protein
MDGAVVNTYDITAATVKSRRTLDCTVSAA